MSNSDENLVDLNKNKGIFGFGFSHNNNLDLLNLVILAYAGIFIQFFFSSNHDPYGLNGPATIALWGYGLTGIAIFLMIFISIYINNKKNIKNSKHTFENKEGVFDAIKSIIVSDSLPIVLTLGIIFYIFFINYTYFEKINRGFIPDTYNTYSLFSSILLISQIGLIVKYLYNDLDSLVFSNNSIKDKETTIIKSLSYILITLNFVFILIMHILIGFFSTDG